jgi:hypothetical protein
VKKKKFTKKLNLGKATIVNLNVEARYAIRGGNTVTCATAGCCKLTKMAGTICVTYCTMCNSDCPMYGCDEPD